MKKCLIAVAMPIMNGHVNRYGIEWDSTCNSPMLYR